MVANQAVLKPTRLAIHLPALRVAGIALVAAAALGLAWPLFQQSASPTLVSAAVAEPVPPGLGLEFDCAIGYCPLPIAQ